MSSRLGEYTVVRAPAEARSSRPDAKTRRRRKSGFDFQRPGSSERGPRLRMPERKQVNRYQAFVEESENGFSALT
jgi:hypothetical protein